MFILRLLGGASLEGPDGPVAGRAGLRHRLALLAVLGVEHPRPVSRDKLVAYLWPRAAPRMDATSFAIPYTSSARLSAMTPSSALATTSGSTPTG